MSFIPSSIASLTPLDQARFQAMSSGPSSQSSFECVHHAFMHHARLRPHAIAVEHLDQFITYGDLDRRSTLLAVQLRALGIRPERRVCVLARRSIANCIAVLAVLKAGGQYIPLDGDTITESALTHIVRDSGASLALTMSDFADKLRGMPLDSIIIDHVADESYAMSADFDNLASSLEDWSGGQDGVYVIYTSGTTGKPKGVDVRHSGITNFICQAPGNVGMRPGMRVAQLLNIAFDMGAWELLGSMANGATLCLRGNTKVEWRRTLSKVDIVIATPSVLAQHYPATYPNIQNVIVGGEVCPQDLADSWSQYTNFHTCCGPTEISIANTVQLHVTGQRVSIGSPVPNTSVYVLDEHMQPCAFGEVGTMWVGGAGVSRGYLNLPEVTARSWRDDPFKGYGRMFNTNDLGRWRLDGQLEHLGRADDQVKIKGFRVELDGVAAAMRECPQVDQTIALSIDGELWGFATPTSAQPQAIAAATSRTLPYYAVPTRYITLALFPHTSNGKVDKRALREMATREMASGTVSEVRLPRSLPSSPMPASVSRLETLLAAPSSPMSSAPSSPMSIPLMSPYSSPMSSPSLSPVVQTPSPQEESYFDLTRHREGKKVVEEQQPEWQGEVVWL